MYICYLDTTFLCEHREDQSITLVKNQISIYVSISFKFYSSTPRTV